MPTSENKNGKTPTAVNFEQRMAAISQSYLKRLGAHVVEIHRLREIMKKGFLPVNDIQRLYRATHNLSGSGGVFGFSEISQAALDLHNALKNLMVDDKKFNQVDADAGLKSSELTDVFKEMDVFEKICRDILEKKQQGIADINDLLSAPAIDKGISQHTNATAVTIMCRKQELAINTVGQLRRFGYSVNLMTSFSNYEKPLPEQILPKILIIYSTLTPEDISFIQTILLPKDGRDIPSLIIVSSKDDYDCRLAAVRLGAKGFFREDTDALKIVDRIEHLLAAKETPYTYNILVVDDDEMLAAFCCYTLENAGMRAIAVNNPKDCLEIIARETIDLVLIDFLMPYCNGRELAAIIRQHENYLSLPIVFMSSQDDVKSLLVNSSLGIDDFLPKPFTPKQLISVVHSRAERAAELRALATRDSLTGLLNHASFLDMLSIELSQTKRIKRSAVYVMIDLDHFKNINDTYGHATGDKIIRILSLMLQQSLRRSDIIGRYGGEEFGVIMTNCKIEEAKEVIESLRAKFSETPCRVESKDVYITFSAGLAEIVPEMSDINAIINTADKALYEAKTLGRNCIIVGKHASI